MANIVNQYGIDAAGNAARTNIPGTNYTVPASRRLLVTDLEMQHTGTGNARMFLEDTTAVADLHSMFIAAAGTLHRQFRTPIEVAAAHVLNCDYIQTAVIGSISLRMGGKLET
ncbi:MAG: hypothetical protein KKD44_29470 [Proteobacteria bacterium]|nr:hypothetical protein [Pseudomonadota bacterium]